MLQNQEIIVIANGEPPSESLINSLLRPTAKLIAIDGGLNLCEEYHLKPDLIMGDFDSVSPSLLEKYDDRLKIPMLDQMECDLKKALDYLLSFSPSQVTVLGALGKRIDHTLSNISMLTLFPEKVKFETDAEILFALSKNVKIKCAIGQTLSLIPFDEASHVETKGLKWNLNKETLNAKFVGISNVALQESVSISFEQGNLFLCLAKTKL